jgi:hypothetical protein
MFSVIISLQFLQTISLHHSPPIPPNGILKSFSSKSAPKPYIIPLQILQNIFILVAFAADSNTFPVLRRRSQHRGAADIDVFNRFVEGTVGVGDGGL